MRYELQPFEQRRSEKSPTVEVGKEAIRLVVNEVRREGQRVDVEFHASFMLPDQVAGRYRDLNSAWVLVVTDVDGRDAFAVRVVDDFIKYEPGAGPPEDNLKAPPPLPLALRGDPAGTSFTGGFLGGAFWFETKTSPVHRPSVFLYLILENFVSNTVGLDLIGQRAVDYRGT